MLLFPQESFATSDLPDVRDNPSFDGIPGDFFELDLGETMGAQRISRLFFIGVRNERRIVNLSNRIIEKGQLSAPRLLTSVEESSRGYSVSRMVSVNLGFGPSWLFSPGSPFSTGAGVMPLVGGRAFARFHTNTLKEAKSLSVLRMPEHIGDVQSWQDGDRIFYLGVGGVVFSGGIGLQGLFGAGVRLFVDGEWVFSLQKIDNSNARACVARGKSASVAVSVGTALSFVEASLIRSYDRNICFRLSLSAPESDEAYRTLFRGGVHKIQELADAQVGWVRTEVSSETVSHGGFVNWFLGLPEFFYAFKSSGYLRGHDASELQGTRHLERNFSSYLQEKARGGFFLNDKTIRSDFSIQVQRVIDRQIEEAELGSTRYFGQFRWHYDQERGKQKSYRRAIRDLIAKTGLRDTVDSDIPEEPSGYVEANLVVDYSAAAWDELCGVVPGHPNLITQSALSRFIQYFNNSGDPDHVCKGRWFCKRSLKREIKNAGSKMYEGVLRACTAQTPQDYVDGFAILGKEQQANQFLFKGLLDILPPDSFHTGFVVSGERLEGLVVKN